MQEPVAHELKEIDGRILKVLAQGRNVPSNLAEELDVSRQWVNQRLQQMESADYVRNVGRGVYELQPGEVPDDDLDRLGITLDDVSEIVEERDQLEAERNQYRQRAKRLERERDTLEERLASVDVDAVRRALGDIEAAAERGDGDALQAALERAREAIGDA